MTDERKTLLDTTELEIPSSMVVKAIEVLELSCPDVDLFHRIFIPFLKGLGISDPAVVSILRGREDDGVFKISKFTLRRAFINTKKVIGSEHDEDHVHLVFEFCRRIGFSTLDTIKVFCNDRIA